MDAVIGCIPSSSSPPLPMMALQAYYRHVGIQFLGIPAYDTITFDLSKYFKNAADFIDQALQSGGRVLVHCHAGISRSATIVACYLMLKKSMTAQEAIRTIR